MGKKFDVLQNGRYALVCIETSHPDVDRLFHYAIPDDISLEIGMRVCVPFGRGNKPISGYVIDFSDTIDFPPSKIKSIISLYEPYPILSPELLTLAHWMRDKYYTTLAACLSCIQPPGLNSKAKARPRGVAPHPARDSSLDPVKSVELTDEQRNVMDYIGERLLNGDIQPILLHGVTGSGKTEVYLRAIAQTLQMGRQAIMLVPEISLTPQMVAAFTQRFGEQAAVTHSRMTPKERFLQWEKARTGAISVMIGPRSAVFAPFDNLGIIIIDEEHEHTYRSESAPKFAAYEVAIKRGELNSALVVMGSATPSLTAYYRAKSLQTEEEPSFALLTMSERVNRMFPKVHIVDMRRELVTGNTSIFSMVFQDAVAKTLARGQQVILFLNRRGHSAFVSCRKCGHVMGCDNCRVNFTYHAMGESLRCHYCGRTAPIPKICPACLAPHIRYFGLGTQKIEEETAKLFPTAKAIRMDMDTTRRKNGHANIISAFRKGEAQILIGTQMIAKGLDFPNVTLVGIVAADMSLFSGDFRAGEHTFQLLTQVSGRAGRAEQSGNVYIQTYNPENYAISLAQRADYAAFYAHEISVRRTMGYPPFSHVFMVLFAGLEEKPLITALHKLLAIMQYCNKKGMFEMLGPAPAFVSKIKKQFRWKLLVKCEQEEILKQFVLYCLRKLKENDSLTGITIHLTLDPETME